jgi:hypothetical protein
MDANTSTFLIIVCGVVLVEIGGIWLVIRSHKFQNPPLIRKYGMRVCVLGIIGLILGFIALYFGM